MPGFDIILCGHNHNVANKKIVNSAGDTVLILEGGSRAEKIARADVTFHTDRLSGKKQKSLKAELLMSRIMILILSLLTNLQLRGK